jgi:hypothetical protein
MSLTGRPLILLTGVLTVLVVAATVRLWRTRRLPVRAIGLILVETLVVLTAGLIANRVAGFYPSWRALAGDLGTTTRTDPQASGRLDTELAGTRDGLPWTPSAETATLIPPPGYGQLADRAFPVVVVLTTGAPAPRIRAVPDVVTVVLTRVPETADLARLPGWLERDARVTSHDWAIVTDRRYAPLAAEWSRLAPGRFRTVVVVDARGPAAALDAAARQLPAPLAPPVRLPS